MCGIAGEIDFRPTGYLPREVYTKMGECLTPRGPDAFDMVQSGVATLIHTRLAVVDLMGGAQPMKRLYQGQNYTLVYNGELYNTEDIRRELLQFGYEFQGHSDTEVLLCAFLQWGEGCLARLNGIFSFAVWKEKEERLFFARDRMGVKPLFYAHDGEQFLFASEIKALLAHPSVSPRVSRSSLAEMILLGPAHKMGECVFSQIEEVKSAHCGWFGRDGLYIKPYWSLVDKPCTDSLEDIIAQVRYLVTDAVERQVLCDVPVCTFLSGGLDSSIITAIAAKTLEKEGGTLHTFSVDYTDNEKHFTPTHFSPSRDNYYIDLVTEAYHTKHHTIMLDTPALVRGLFAAVEARDVPGMADVDSSLLLFCKEVKEHATVALSGECADELFGGYPWFRDKDIREQAGFPWAQNTSYRMSFLREEFATSIESSRLISQYYEETLAQTHKHSGKITLDNRMKEMTRLNTDWFMQTLLERKDRMSMANGLEVRVPFCDYRIAELLYTVPWSLKEYEGFEKGILRKSIEGLLPDEVLWRKKSPYPKTWNPNYREAVSQLLQAVIDNPSSPLLQIISKESLLGLLNADNTTPWYGQLMTTPQTIAYFVQMNYWLTQYQIEVTP